MQWLLISSNLYSTNGYKFHNALCQRTLVATIKQFYIDQLSRLTYQLSMWTMKNLVSWQQKLLNFYLHTSTCCIMGHSPSNLGHTPIHHLLLCVDTLAILRQPQWLLLWSVSGFKENETLLYLAQTVGFSPVFSTHEWNLIGFLHHISTQNVKRVRI